MAPAASRPAAFCVEDLKGYLAGDWRLVRVCLDRRREIVGRLRGIARFTATAEGLRYRERGCLRFGDFHGEAHRDYRYAFPRLGIAHVLFADGTPFHDLDLSRGPWCARHACAPDMYEGEFLAISPLRWHASWRVAGPRKDLFIRGCYRR